MLYRVITAGFSHVHTEHINTLCEQNIEFFSVKLVVYIVTIVL